MEMRLVETVTLTTQQILTGDKEGRPATLAGELRIPTAGTTRIPAVILIHGGSGVLTEMVDRWVPEINSLGIATFVLDTYSGRGIHNNRSEQAGLSGLAMMVDAYRALAMLAQHDLPGRRYRPSAPARVDHLYCPGFRVATRDAFTAVTVAAGL